MRNALILLSIFWLATSCNASDKRKENELNCNAKDSLQKALTLMNFSAEGNANFDSIRVSRNKSALKLLNESLKCDPTFVASNYWKSTTLIQLKKYSEALESANDGIKNSTSDHRLIEELYQMRGLLNYKIGETDAAQVDFKKSLELYKRELKKVDNDMKRIDIIVNMSA